MIVSKPLESQTSGLSSAAASERETPVEERGGGWGVLLACGTEGGKEMGGVSFPYGTEGGQEVGRASPSGRAWTAALRVSSSCLHANHVHERGSRW